MPNSESRIAYQQAPTLAERRRLGHRFEDLFRTVTGYDALDARIAKTHARRDSLLVVLDHPEIPLHNNAAGATRSLQTAA